MFKKRVWFNLFVVVSLLVVLILFVWLSKQTGSAGEFWESIRMTYGVDIPKLFWSSEEDQKSGEPSWVRFAHPLGRGKGYDLSDPAYRKNPPKETPESQGYERLKTADGKLLDHFYFRRYNDPSFSYDHADVCFPVGKRLDEPGLRVLILGNSVVEMGAGKNRTDLWCSRLEQKLTQAIGQPVVVIPLGVGSWVSFQERLALEAYGWYAKPDVVLTLDGVSDALSATSGDRPGDRSFYSADLTVFAGLVSIATETGRMNLINSHEVDEALAVHVDEVLANPGPYTQMVASEYVKNIRAIKESCGYRGVPMVPILQPIRSLSRPPKNIEIKPHENLVGPVYEEMKKLYGPDLQDLSACLAPVVEDFGDVCHFGTPRSHDLLAESMVPIVKPLLDEVVVSRSKNDKK